MEQKHVLLTDQEIQTNSLIKIPIPTTNNNTKYSVKWSRQCPWIINSQFKGIFSREDPSKNNTLQYQCNPLDYQSVISAKIIQGSGQREEIVEEMDFGPVAFEDQIAKQLQNPERFKVKIVVNKTSLLPGKITFTSCPFVLNNNYKAGVIFSAENFEFQLKIQKGIMMPPNSPFLKIYPKEENSLGISIFHQHPQLMEKLRAINIFVHVGYYLKFYFENQKFRDLFIFDILQYFRVIQNLPPLLQSPVIKISAVPELQKSSFGTHFSNEGRRKNEDEKNKQVDDEIYNLLYDKSSNQQIEQRDAQLSFENAAAFILSSIRKSGINKLKKLNMSKQKNEVSQKLMRPSKKLNSNKSNQVLQKKNYRGSFDKFEKKWSLEDQIPTNQSPVHHHKNFFKSQENLTQQCQLRNTITRLTEQIDGLLKENRKLSQENKKLKEQNMKWRYKEIKKTFKNTIKQKFLNASKVGYEKSRNINSLKLIPSSPPLKALSYTNLNRQNFQKSNNLLVVSKTTVPKENTVESPCSNGLSQPTNFYERKKNQINFTSCISVLNKEFIEQPTKKQKFVPRKRKIIRLNRSIESKNSKTEMNKSFDKCDQPATPFFTIQNGRDPLHMKTHQSLFFRQYFKD